MGFWWFMLSIVALCPLIMIIFGAIFKIHTPKAINSFFGYRTKLSMQNSETWEFAHRYFGRLWLLFGIPLLFFSMLGMLILLGKSTEFIGALGIALAFFGFLVMLVPVFLTEKALRRNFDDEGNKLSLEN